MAECCGPSQLSTTTRSRPSQFQCWNSSQHEDHTVPKFT